MKNSPVPALAGKDSAQTSGATFSSKQDEADAHLLVNLAHEGNREAFDALVLKYHRLMVNAAFRVMRHVEDAQDAAQNAWVKMWKALQSTPIPAEVSVLAVICANGRQAAVDLFKYRGAMKRGAGLTLAERTAAFIQEVHGLYAYRRGQNVHHITERTPEDDPLRSIGLVRRLAPQLPAQHLNALNGYFFGSESLEAIAGRLGVSVDDTKRLLKSGADILRHLAESLTPAEVETLAA